MDNKETALITLEYKDILKLLNKFEKEMPGIGRKLINAVNNEAKKRIRSEYKKRGYKAKNPKHWGDAGYSKNLKSYANRDFSGKILMAQNAFYYRFLEFGTNHKPMIIRRGKQIYKVKGFSIPAKPVLYPIANSIWKTDEAVKIMEKKFQQELDKKINGVNK